MIRCDNRPATKMTPRQRLLPGMLRRVRRLLPGRSASCCCWRCRAAALDDRAAAGVWIESVERLVRRGSVGLELDLTLRNDTKHVLKIRRAELDIYL